MIEMVVFDMAGTTVNEGNVVYKTLRSALQEAGHEVSLEAVLEHGAGKEKKQAIKDVLQHLGAGDLPETEVDAIFNSFLTRLKQAYEELEVSTFNGTESLFAYLHSKEVKVVLNTGYDRRTATRLLEKLQWQEGTHFDLLVTADDVQRGRPHPDMITLAMAKLAVEDSQSVIKIGDSMIDIEEGKAAGCGFTLGVTTGAQSAQQLASARPNYVVDSLNYLRELV